MSTKNKILLSIVLIVVGGFVSVIAAASEGGVIAMFFTAVLALGLDMLTDGIAKKNKKI